MIWRAAGVHEGLRHNGETRVHNVRLSKIKNEVGIFYQVHPKSEKQYWLKGSTWNFIIHLRGREFDFQVWTTSESVMPCCRAWSSKKSNKYWKYNPGLRPHLIKLSPTQHTGCRQKRKKLGGLQTAQRVGLQNQIFCCWWRFGSPKKSYIVSNFDRVGR